MIQLHTSAHDTLSDPIPSNNFSFLHSHPLTQSLLHPELTIEHTSIRPEVAQWAAVLTEQRNARLLLTGSTAKATDT